MPPVSIEQWTEFLRNGKRRSKLKIPFEKQQNLIAYLFQPDPKRIKQADLCCGRGYGKSILSIYIATMALSLSSTEIGLFLEPDWKRVKRVFLKKWRQLVPKELYEINLSDQCITWLPTGSLLFYGPRNITGSQGAADDSQLGQDTTFVIDDEAALRCSETMYTNTLATIREPSNVRFYLTLSTPRVGSYQRLVQSDNHLLFRGHSDDNPYLPENYVSNLRKNMSTSQARRELDGEFISLEGRIWSDSLYDPKVENKDTAWPKGNRNDIHTKFDSDSPWWLFCDIGSATGAYVVVQQMPPVYRGRMLYSGVVWVAVADYCPNNDASAARAFQRLAELYGTPVVVVAGADISTRASTDGRTVSYYAQKVWGNVMIKPCNESVYNKLVQHDIFSYLICANGEDRRFTIARDFVEIDKDSRRGMKQLLNEDEYPELEDRKDNEFMPKGKKYPLCHVRDAILMGSVEVMKPPRWGFTKDQVG